MKKLLLPYLFISLTILLIIVQQVNAQTKEPLSCQDLEKILDSKECPRWVIESDKLWCAQRTEELMYLPKEGDIVKLFRNRPPDYTLLPNNWPCPDKESTQPEQQPAPTSEESQSSTVQPPTKKEQFNLSPIFGINPYQTWLKLNNWVKTFGRGGETFNDLLVALVDHEFCRPEDCEKATPLLERKPVLSEQEVKLEPVPSDNSPWPFIMPFTIQTDKDESVFYNIPGLEQKGVIKVLPDTQLELPQVELDWGEAEFYIIGSSTKAFKVTTPNAEVKVLGTHFWVSYNREQKQTAVGVYEGEVEIKSKDGKTTTISPDGDKPGVIVVTQKLSPVKLAVLGLILAAVIGGIIFFLKRKKKK